MSTEASNDLFDASLEQLALRRARRIVQTIKYPLSGIVADCADKEMSITLFDHVQFPILAEFKLPVGAIFSLATHTQNGESPSRHDSSRDH